MTTDNSERIKAAAEEIAKLAMGWQSTGTFLPDVREILHRHFGESAPEQKEGHVARIYADGRWIRAECLLCEWSGVKWKARKGSGLPNAKAILQHSLRDHLLFKHVEKLPVAPSVDTNAEPNCSAAHPERLQLHCMLIRGHDGDHANGYVVWPADAAQEPTCAAIFMVHMPQGYSKPMGRCGRLAGDPIHDPAAQSTSRHTFVESSVLPSKSERE